MTSHGFTGTIRKIQIGVGPVGKAFDPPGSRKFEFFSSSALFIRERHGPRRDRLLLCGS